MLKIKEEILEFRNERDWEQFHTKENLAKSISIEAGELLECFQWDNNYNFENVCDELADVVNYCILLAHSLDVDLETIIKNKLEKNRLKYPVDKARGISTKYNNL